MDIPTILHLYGPSNRVSKYMWQKLIDLQGEIDDSTVTGGDSNTALSEMDRSSRQKISKDIIEFNSIIDQLDDIYRALHQSQ